MSDKDCYLAYTKNPYNSTIRKEKNLVKQWEKDPDRYLSKEDIQMVNKHMEGCSTPYLPGNWKSKQQWDVATYLLEWPKSWTLTSNAGADENNKNSHSLLMGIQSGLAIWKTVWQFLTKVNILLPNDPAMALLGNYLNELKNHVHTKVSTRMFVEALFIITKIWKQPRYPSVGELINNL